MSPGAVPATDHTAAPGTPVPARVPGKRRRRQWLLPSDDVPATFEPEATALVRRVLWSRRDLIGPDPQAFLSPGLVPLADTLGMLGMTAAVDLVAEAIIGGRRIAIFGDYDADGLTATALLQRGLSMAGADVITYIPHRINDGYGLSEDGLQELHRQGAELVITCDCGTNSADVVAARPAGQRIIVTDHHLPAPTIAAPDALLNPHQSGCPYPFKELSGAGVAFKLMQAVAAAPALSGRLDEADVEQLMQLVAIGAVADVVPLVGENRALVRRGLEVLDDVPLPGVRALIDVGTMKRPLNSGAIGFQLAPRINAAGRMDDARLALDLLLASTMDEAWPIAERLERHNQDRKAATDQALAEVVERLEAEGVPDSAIVIADERWSLGLVGLIAGRLVDVHDMPAFVLNRGEDECRGSARSIAGFNVVDALASCDGVLTRFGGHEAAAGFACPSSRFGELVEGLQAYAAAHRPEGGWSRVVSVDAVVNLEQLSNAAVEDLSTLEPFGQGHPAPRFCVQDVELKSSSSFGGDGDHLRLWFGQGETVVEAIGWRRGHFLENYRRAGERGARLDAIFSVEINSWDGEGNVRLELEDVRRSEAPAT